MTPTHPSVNGGCHSSHTNNWQTFDMSADSIPLLPFSSSFITLAPAQTLESPRWTSAFHEAPFRGWAFTQHPPREPSESKWPMRLRQDVSGDSCCVTSRPAPQRCCELLECSRADSKTQPGFRGDLAKESGSTCVLTAPRMTQLPCGFAAHEGARLVLQRERDCWKQNIWRQAAEWETGWRVLSSPCQSPPSSSWQRKRQQRAAPPVWQVARWLRPNLSVQILSGEIRYPGDLWPPLFYQIKRQCADMLSTQYTHEAAESRAQLRTSGKCHPWKDRLKSATVLTLRQKSNSFVLKLLTSTLVWTWP